jgi:hypothetical protein
MRAILSIRKISAQCGFHPRVFVSIASSRPVEVPSEDLAQPLAITKTLLGKRRQRAHTRATLHANGPPHDVHVGAVHRSYARTTERRVGVRSGGDTVCVSRRRTSRLRDFGHVLVNVIAIDSHTVR